ncbi:MAG: TetR-like C-terminal domain-containing protein [Patulibacter minatonensis]
MVFEEPIPASQLGPPSFKGTRPGGRSARVREAVLAATAIELMEHGPSALTFARVAARAGVAPTTVSRRWGTPVRLVADMFGERAITSVPDPEQDSLEADLTVFAEQVASALGQPEVQTMLRVMFSLPPDELAPIQEAYWSARVDVAQAIIDRAIERGEVPADTLGWDVMEPLLSPIWMRRLITGMPIDGHTLARIVGNALEIARARA